MSYCVNCGVELADSEKCCPLCNVEVVNPNRPWVEPAQRPYSQHFEELTKRMDRRYFTALAGLILLIPVLVTVLCDILSGGGITWSAYVVGAIAMLYVFILLPFNFKRYHAVVFLSLNFFAVLLYLLLIEQASGGHWFLSIGLPIVICTWLIVIGYSQWFKRRKRAILLKTGLCLIAAGVLSVIIEVILSINSAGALAFRWSFYVMIPCLVLGIVALVLEHRKNLKEVIRKKLFY